MSKRRPTSTCVLCGAETPEDMRYCTRCAGKLLSPGDAQNTPSDLPYLISEARTIDAQSAHPYPYNAELYPRPKRRRR